VTERRAGLAEKAAQKVILLVAAFSPVQRSVNVVLLTKSNDAGCSVAVCPVFIQYCWLIAADPTSTNIPWIRNCSTHTASRWRHMRLAG